MIMETREGLISTEDTTVFITIEDFKMSEKELRKWIGTISDRLANVEGRLFSLFWILGIGIPIIISGLIGILVKLY